MDRLAARCDQLETTARRLADLADGALDQLLADLASLKVDAGELMDADDDRTSAAAMGAFERLCAMQDALHAEQQRRNASTASTTTTTTSTTTSTDRTPPGGTARDDGRTLPPQVRELLSRRPDVRHLLSGREPRDKVSDALALIDATITEVRWALDHGDGTGAHVNATRAGLLRVLDELVAEKLTVEDALFAERAGPYSAVGVASPAHRERQPGPARAQDGAHPARLRPVAGVLCAPVRPRPGRSAAGQHRRRARRACQGAHPAVRPARGPGRPARAPRHDAPRRPPRRRPGAPGSDHAAAL